LSSASSAESALSTCDQLSFLQIFSRFMSLAYPVTQHHPSHDLRKQSDPPLHCQQPWQQSMLLELMVEQKASAQECSTSRVSQ
jgi:hypothetical protein